jgi:O-antigen ligase
LGFLLAGVLKRAAELEIPAVQRVLSPFKDYDFSSRNRLAAFQDGLEMLFDRPVQGYGWRNIMGLHDSLYLRPELAEGSALRLNDFLIIGIRLGIPSVFALFFFGAFWLNIGASKLRETGLPAANKQSPADSFASIFLKAERQDLLLCRAAVLTFAIGLLFNDGLLRLAIGGPLWLFLTFSVDLQEISERRTTDKSRLQQAATWQGKREQDCPRALETQQASRLADRGCPARIGLSY